MGRGYPPPQPTIGGLGSVVSSSSGVGGRAPAEKLILVHFELEKNESGGDKFDIFCHFYSAYLESNLQGYFFSFTGA